MVVGSVTYPPNVYRYILQFAPTFLETGIYDYLGKKAVVGRSPTRGIYATAAGTHLVVTRRRFNTQVRKVGKENCQGIFRYRGVPRGRY